MLVERRSIFLIMLLCDDILCPLMYSPSDDVTSLSPSDKHNVQSGTNVSTVPRSAQTITGEAGDSFILKTWVSAKELEFLRSSLWNKHCEYLQINSYRQNSML